MPQELIDFRGSVKRMLDGEQVMNLDLDFTESWPETSRFLYHMPATTAAVNIALGHGKGTLASAKLVAFKAEKPIVVRLNAQTASEGTTTRGVFIIQTSSATLILTNTAAHSGGNDVSILVAGA